MHASNSRSHSLHISTGEFPLAEYRLRAVGREWTILHTGVVLTLADEAHFFRELRERLPYGCSGPPNLDRYVSEYHTLQERGHENEQPTELHTTIQDPDRT